MGRKTTIISQPAMGKVRPFFSGIILLHFTKPLFLRKSFLLRDNGFFVSCFGRTGRRARQWEIRYG